MSKPKIAIETLRKSLNSAKNSLLKKLGKKPSVSAICKEAGISRAYLYASFPQLVDELCSTPRLTREKKRVETIANLKAVIKELRISNQLLARSCIELKIALTELQSKYHHATKPKRKGTAR